MNTIGWLFLFAAVLIFRQVSRGRGISKIPGDLGDLLTAILTNNRAAVSEVLSRKEDLTPNITDNSSSDSSGNPTSSDGIPRSQHNQASLIALGKWLKSQGFSVAEGPPPFGPISSGHISGSYHFKTDPTTGVKGMALDVNLPGAGGINTAEVKAFDALAPKLQAAGWHILWRVSGHYDHLHVDTG